MVHFIRIGTFSHLRHNKHIKNALVNQNKNVSKMYSRIAMNKQMVVMLVKTRSGNFQWPQDSFVNLRRLNIPETAKDLMEE